MQKPGSNTHTSKYVKHHVYIDDNELVTSEADDNVVQVMIMFCN